MLEYKQIAYAKLTLTEVEKSMPQGEVIELYIIKSSTHQIRTSGKKLQ